MPGAAVVPSGLGELFVRKDCDASTISDKGRGHTHNLGYLFEKGSIKRLQWFVSTRWQCEIIGMSSALLLQASCVGQESQASDDAQSRARMQTQRQLECLTQKETSTDITNFHFFQYSLYVCTSFMLCGTLILWGRHPHGLRMGFWCWSRSERTCYIIFVSKCWWA